MGRLLLAGLMLAGPTPQLAVPVVVEQPTEGPVVAVLADVTVSAPVRGDVVAVLGDVRLQDGADVAGDVVVVGGVIRGAGRVSGRAVSVGVSGGGSVEGPVRTVWGLSLLRAGLWLVSGWLLLLVFPRAVRVCASELGRQRGRLLLIGALALSVWLAAMVVAVAATSSPVGAGLLLLGVVALLAVKLVGLAGLALALGRLLARRLGPAVRGEVPATALALAALLALSMIPGVGGPAWALASLLGVALGVSAALSRLRSAVPAPSGVR